MSRPRKCTIETSNATLKFEVIGENLFLYVRMKDGTTISTLVGDGSTRKLKNWLEHFLNEVGR